jgi:putative ABC transport system substrate-binding protein
MFDRNRREFIPLLGATAVTRPAWPLAARAQQLPRIGSIHTTRSENSEAFFQALREGGYVDGQNVLLESRFSEGVLNPVDEFARELVALKCSVIFASNPYAIRAATHSSMPSAMRL